MRNLVLSSLLMVLVGCGSDGMERVNQPATEVVNLTPEEESIVDRIVESENTLRLSKGQSILTKGLTCSLYNLNNTRPSTIPSNPGNAIATFVYQGSFNQQNTDINAGLNILPNGLRQTYKQYYMVRCVGFLVMETSYYPSFYLTSDDGSKLWVDNVLVVNNDGLHSETTVVGTKHVQEGLRPFKLEYMQAAGRQTLKLEDEFGVIASGRFFR